ncbi:bola-like protein [Filobasidium floriforme]|uniref:bola-like protein n=1 Tax=Filobasidium floriforme TaxID=5210 RepID=UPI001E8CA97B|nr:bola-like protein [Filobasidium floriforme]KAH8087983.1 bola-like protein [Filobasidium floriforme]
MSSTIPGPVQSSMHRKLSEGLKPVFLEIRNERVDISSKHAHHSAMRAVGGGNGETHFSVTMASEAFNGLTPIKRHRLVNGLLKEEFEQMGLHALSLRLKNVEEAEREGLVQDKSARADVPSCKGSVI